MLLFYLPIINVLMICQKGDCIANEWTRVIVRYCISCLKYEERISKFLCDLLYCNSEFSPVFTIISITIFFRRHAGVPLENTCEVAL